MSIRLCLNLILFLTTARVMATTHLERQQAELQRLRGAITKYQQGTPAWQILNGQIVQQTMIVHEAEQQALLARETAARTLARQRGAFVVGEWGVTPAGHIGRVVSIEDGKYVVAVGDGPQRVTPTLRDLIGERVATAHGQVAEVTAVNHSTGAVTIRGVATASASGQITGREVNTNLRHLSGEIRDHADVGKTIRFANIPDAPNVVTAPVGEAVAGRNLMALPEPPQRAVTRAVFGNGTVLGQLENQVLRVITPRMVRAVASLTMVGLLAEFALPGSAHAAYYGDQYLQSPEKFAEFFDLPLAQREALYENNPKIKAAVNKFYEQQLNSLGGKPQNLVCSDTQITFSTDPDVATNFGTRFYTINRGESGRWTQITMRKPNPIGDSRVEYELNNAGEYVRVRPAFASFDRQWPATQNRPMSFSEFQTATQAASTKSLGRTIRAAGNIQEYMRFISHDLDAACSRSAAQSSTALADSRPAEPAAQR